MDQGFADIHATLDAYQTSTGTHFNATDANVARVFQLVDGLSTDVGSIVQAQNTSNALIWTRLDQLGNQLTAGFGSSSSAIQNLSQTVLSNFEFSNVTFSAVFQRLDDQSIQIGSVIHQAQGNHTIIVTHLDTLDARVTRLESKTNATDTKLATFETEIAADLRHTNSSLTALRDIVYNYLGVSNATFFDVYSQLGSQAIQIGTIIHNATTSSTFFISQLELANQRREIGDTLLTQQLWHTNSSVTSLRAQFATFNSEISGHLDQVETALGSHMDSTATEFQNIYQLFEDSAVRIGTVIHDANQNRTFILAHVDEADLQLGHRIDATNEAFSIFKNETLTQWRSTALSITDLSQVLDQHFNQSELTFSQLFELIAGQTQYMGIFAHNSYANQTLLATQITTGLEQNALQTSDLQKLVTRSFGLSNITFAHLYNITGELTQQIATIIKSENTSHTLILSHVGSELSTVHHLIEDQSVQIGVLIRNSASNYTWFAGELGTLDHKYNQTTWEIKARIDGLTAAIADHTQTIVSLDTTTKKNSEAIELLELKTGNLTKTIGGFGPQLEALAKSIGEYGPQLAALAKSIGEYGPELEELARSIGNFAPELESLARNIGEYGPQLESLALTFDGIQPQLDELRKALDAIPTNPDGTPQEVTIPTTEQVEAIPPQKATDALNDNLDAIKNLDPVWLSNLKSIGYYAMLIKSIWDLVVFTWAPIHFVMEVQDGNSFIQRVAGAFVKVVQWYLIAHKLKEMSKGIAGPTGPAFNNAIKKMQYAALISVQDSERRRQLMEKIPTIEARRNVPGELYQSHQEVTSWTRSITDTSHALLAGNLKLKKEDLSSGQLLFAKKLFLAYWTWRETAQIRMLIDTLLTRHARHQLSIEFADTKEETWKSRTKVQNKQFENWPALADAMTKSEWQAQKVGLTQETIRGEIEAQFKQKKAPKFAKLVGQSHANLLLVSYAPRILADVSREMQTPFDLELDPYKSLLDDCSDIIEQFEQINEDADALNNLQFFEFLNRTKQFKIGKSRTELEIDLAEKLAAARTQLDLCVQRLVATCVLWMNHYLPTAGSPESGIAFHSQNPLRKIVESLEEKIEDTGDDAATFRQGLRAITDTLSVTGSIMPLYQLIQLNASVLESIGVHAIQSRHRHTAHKAVISPEEMQQMRLAVDKINNPDDPMAFLDRPKHTKPFGNKVAPETVVRRGWSCWPLWAVHNDETDSETGSDPSRPENKRLEASSAGESQQPGTPPGDIENGLLRQESDGINGASSHASSPVFEQGGDDSDSESSSHSADPYAISSPSISSDPLTNSQNAIFAPKDVPAPKLARHDSADSGFSLTPSEEAEFERMVYMGDSDSDTARRAEYVEAYH